MPTKKRATPKKAVQKPVQISKVKKSNSGLAIAALILNIIILPGLGSLIAGKTKAGLWQVILFLIGLILSATIILAVIGIPVILFAWIWGIITGAKLIKEAR